MSAQTDVKEEGGLELPVGNYYGNLRIRKVGDAWEWCVENYDGCDWMPCPAAIGEVLVANAAGAEEVYEQARRAERGS